MAIKKIAVIGAGVMGAGIAAQAANAGYDVELLDRPAPSGANRSAIAEGALEKLLKTKPAPLMHPKNIKKIRAGNMEDDAARLKECDLIIEAVFEDPKVKFDIFQKIDANRKEGSIVASNTSTIPLHDLINGQSEALKKDFVITHFFNPPRYMQLLELITSEYNDQGKVAELTQFLDEKMGKGVIPCNDTPGFIGNRIGTFWMQCAINEAYNKNLTIEEADALMGKPLGIPKTGVFGLLDVVGLDLIPHISKSLISKLPVDDGYCKGTVAHPVIDKMIADGFTGRKTKAGGFYRRTEAKEDLSVDLNTGKTRPKKKSKLRAVSNAEKKGIRGLLDTKDKNGEYAWSVMKQTLCYAAEHVHTITGNITNLDQAMKLGYGWKYGPFEMIDKMGTDYFIKRLKADGDTVPAFLQKAAGRTFYSVANGKQQFLNKDGNYEEVQRPPGVLLLSDVKLAAKPVKKNASASLWDIGDGVLCLEFHTPGNTLDKKILKMINHACDTIGDGKGKYKALVIHNEGENFSAGANLKAAVAAVKAKQYWLVERLVKLGQNTLKRLKYAPFPVVSAPSGPALGGGCEILLNSSRVQAHAETYAGLVEVGVGLLPGWGGCTEMLTRAKQNKRLPGGPLPAVATVFETISTGKVATSAFEAKDLYFLRQTDGVTMNKSRLLADAKAQALEMAKNFTPEKPFDMELPGPAGLAAIDLAVDGFYLKGAATPYDVVVSERVAKVLTGGDDAGPGVKLSQDDLRALERKHFMASVRDSRSFDRIMHIFRTKKPLREKPIAGKKPADLRTEADRPGVLTRTLERGKKTARQAFKAVCANDNRHLCKSKKPKAHKPKP
ncbi:MAG: enoyl-CoA hydratase/isomerase family protein [Proteobacteria bacterium]|nr:enoyl-CoA hydratase/isomerase family protein [Pseudomonadota bacterium]